MKHVQQHERRLKQRVDKSQLVIQNLKDEYERFQLSVRIRGLGRNVGPMGGYTLAIARNKGHASAQTTVDMVASSEAAGELKSKKIVYLYEARLALAIREMFSAHLEEVRDIIKDGDWTVRVTQYRGGWDKPRSG